MDRASHETLWRETEKRTALHLASIHGHQEMVQNLIENKADTACKDFFGNQPIKYAIEFGHHAVVKCLVGAGASL